MSRSRGFRQAKALLSVPSPYRGNLGRNFSVVLGGYVIKSKHFPFWRVGHAQVSFVNLFKKKVIHGGYMKDI